MDQTNEDYLKGVNFFLRPAIRQIRDFVFVERERNGGIYIAHFLVIAPPNECKVIQRKVQAMVNSYNDIYEFLCCEDTLMASFILMKPNVVLSMRR